MNGNSARMKAKCSALGGVGSCRETLWGGSSASKTSERKVLLGWKDHRGVGNMGIRKHQKSSDSWSRYHKTRQILHEPLNN